MSSTNYANHYMQSIITQSLTYFKYFIEGSEWMTTASASDSESGSVSSWNSTSDNGNSSPYRDCGDDSSEDVSSQCNESGPSSKRPRLESNNLLALIKSLPPEKKICH